LLWKQGKVRYIVGRRLTCKKGARHTTKGESKAARATSHPRASRELIDRGKRDFGALAVEIRAAKQRASRDGRVQ
jgi:hypothetical protein